MPLQIDRITRTDADGRFALRVVPGTYTLHGPDRTTPETITVADQPELVHDFAMPRPEKGPISGRVVLAADRDRGVAGAKVEGIVAVWGAGSPFTATTDADGRFRGERRLDPMVFHAASPDGSLAGIVEVGADDTEVVIPIGPTASASGQVLDDRGRPIADRILRWSRPVRYVDVGPRGPYGNHFGSEAKADAAGRFTVTGMIVGQEYQIRVQTGPNQFPHLTTVRPQDAGPIDMETFQLGAAGVLGSFRGDAPRLGGPAPAIRATALDGRPLSPDAFRGKYVLLAFWGTWCGTCLDEIPNLQAVADTFGTDPRFALVGLTVDASIDAPRRFAADHKLPGLQAFAGPRVPGSVADDFGVRGVPAMILIGPDGKVVARGMRGETIKTAVAEALSKAP